HRYRIAEWSEETNQHTFGVCVISNYHGHTYVCDVTVTADIDQKTGFSIGLGDHARTLATEVRARFDHRNINLDVPEFADGTLLPTGENLARFIFERVRAALSKGVTVVRVTVAEDSTLSATYEA